MHRNEGDDGEKFPIIGGLASYIGTFLFKLEFVPDGVGLAGY